MHDLAALIEISRAADGRADLAQAVCELAVQRFGLRGASIGLVQDRSGSEEPHLDSVAAAGTMSPFMQNLSTPLSNVTDAMRSALNGEALFEGNPHGMTEDADVAQGVGRWRNGFRAHAHASLGLTVREGTIGVLTLEWPDPHPFDADDQSRISLFADLVALALKSVPETPEEPPQPEEPFADSVTSPAPPPKAADTPGVAEISAYQMNARGLVVPDAAAQSWRELPVARIWTANTPATTGRTSIAFTEVSVASSRRVAMAACTISSASEPIAAEAEASAGTVMRAAAAHGSEAGDVLAMLGDMARSASGSWASGISAILDPGSGALQVSSGGACLLAIHGRGSRFDLIRADAIAFEPGKAPPSRTLLALPGDRIALLAGEFVSHLPDEARTARIERILGAPSLDGVDVATELLSLGANDGTTAVVIFELVPLPRDE